MFAMLRGPWPRRLADGTSLAALEAEVAAGTLPAEALAAAVERALGEAVAAQVEAGLGLVSDGAVRWADPAAAVLAALRAGDTGKDGMLVRAWQAAAALTDVPVAQAVPGPWSLAGGAAAAAGDLADALAGELEALSAVGCPVVIVDEPGAVALGPDAAVRAAFLAVQRRLLAGAGDLHVMLAVTGGAPGREAADALFGAPFASYLFDLVGGPDNWYLVRAAPGDRGIVCAALRAGDGKERLDQGPELVWAAQYAASANGRGMARIGLANASSLGDLPLEAARTALDGLARAAALAPLPVTEAIEAGLDRRFLHRGTGPAALTRSDAESGSRRPTQPEEPNA